MTLYFIIIFLEQLKLDQKLKKQIQRPVSHKDQQNQQPSEMQRIASKYSVKPIFKSQNVDDSIDKKVQNPSRYQNDQPKDGVKIRKEDIVNLSKQKSNKVNQSVNLQYQQDVNDVMNLPDKIELKKYKESPDQNLQIPSKSNIPRPQFKQEKEQWELDIYAHVFKESNDQKDQEQGQNAKKSSNIQVHNKDLLQQLNEPQKDITINEDRQEYIKKERQNEQQSQDQLEKQKEFERHQEQNRQKDLERQKQLERQKESERQKLEQNLLKEQIEKQQAIQQQQLKEQLQKQQEQEQNKLKQLQIERDLQYKREQQQLKEQQEQLKMQQEQLKLQQKLQDEKEKEIQKEKEIIRQKELELQRIKDQQEKQIQLLEQEKIQISLQKQSQNSYQFDEDNQQKNNYQNVFQEEQLYLGEQQNARNQYIKDNFQQNIENIYQETLQTKSDEEFKNQLKQEFDDDSLTQQDEDSQQEDDLNSQKKQNDDDTQKESSDNSQCYKINKENNENESFFVENLECEGEDDDDDDQEYYEASDDSDQPFKRRSKNEVTNIVFQTQEEQIQSLQDQQILSQIIERNNEDDSYYSSEEENLDSKQENQAKQYHIIMQNKLTQAVRRETELRTIIGIKTRECTSKIGKSSFEEIISFFRSKLNSEQELNEDDQDEIDFILNQKLKGGQNSQIIYTMYKILHLEIENEKCKERIIQIQQQMNQQ